MCAPPSPSSPPSPPARPRMPAKRHAEHALEQPPPKRSRPVASPPPPLPAARPPASPPWLRAAAALFVHNTPPLKWTGGFYSWGTWLHALRHPSLWIPSDSNPLPPWYRLVDACRASARVQGTGALYRAKNDLVSAIVALVYRRAEPQRLTHPNQVHAPERDVMRRVRAVVTRQRRHEASSLTLITFLDLAFVVSAYRHCIGSQHPPLSSSQLETELHTQLAFLRHKVSANDVVTATRRMHAYMWHRRWLPWYDHIPHIPHSILIASREAAHEFSHQLPCPNFHLATGVRGLSRDLLAGSCITNKWLISLLDHPMAPRWRTLAAVYESALSKWPANESKILDEISRCVIEQILQPLTHTNSQPDAGDQCKLVDAIPGIVVTQSARINNLFTFRLLLELHVHLIMFCEYLHSQFYGRLLPSINQIHPGVKLYTQLRKSIYEVRTLVGKDNAHTLFACCIETPNGHQHHEHHSEQDFQRCKTYQQTAIKAALAPAILYSNAECTKFQSDYPLSDSDPLMFAAIISDWDAHLAARIVDAAVRIGKHTREDFVAGKCGGLDLYTHRRVIVCEAAIDRCRGDRGAATGIMTRLNPVWNACEEDKGVGWFSAEGVQFLRSSAEKGNFEAATALGILLSDEAWELARKGCGLDLNFEAGVGYICDAIKTGDVGAARDLIHLLQKQYAQWSEWPECSQEETDVAEKIGKKMRECLKAGAQEVACMELYLGYLYSVGCKGMDADCKAALKSYNTVLGSDKVGAVFKIHAANNVAVLRALHVEADEWKNDDRSIRELLEAAAGGGNQKAESNLAALTAVETHAGEADLKNAAHMYEQIFETYSSKSAVTVIQTYPRSKEMTICELMVEKEKEKVFCRDVGGEGMDLQWYGKVLVKETLALVEQKMEKAKREGTIQV